MESPETPLTARLGDRLQVELSTAEGVEILDLVIVPDRGADFGHGLLGQSTPLAQALLGRPAGLILEYAHGDILAARLLAITPAPAPPPIDETARRREETVRKAVEKARRTNAMIFASSINGKWGDYDPDGIDDWDT